MTDNKDSNNSNPSVANKSTGTAGDDKSGASAMAAFASGAKMQGGEHGLDSVTNIDAYYTAAEERVDPERTKALEGFSNRELMFQFLKNLGEDPKREGLKRTPYRIEKAWEFITEGYQMDVYDFLNRAVFPQECDDIVLVKDIRFYSMCEHHLLPFYGLAHVAYIPDGKVVGLSKLPRIVDMFSRRLQIQEQLCNQVADCIQDVLKPKGVAVIMTGFHFCMMMRGVQKDNAKTTTSAMLGAFRESYETRTELMHLLHQSNV